MTLFDSLKIRFHPEVFATKTFKGLVASLTGVIAAFGAGEVGWRTLGASVALFVIFLCFRDGFISIEKRIAEKAEDCK
jgi:hypothetical protein